MKANRFELILTAALSLSSAVGLAASEPTVYGRAGIPVAEARIEQLAQLKPSERAADASVVRWYGRAGGAVGLERVGGHHAAKAYAAGSAKPKTVYGRAGVPLPFGG